MNEADGVESNYFDIETSNQNNAIGRGASGGVTGLTTAEMTGPSTQDNMPEFDWINIWKTASGYPILMWQEE